ncbi:hypothetical protein T03_1352 [Trichinella britovi]|uniref:Uncharacterized protein n=1 Tax=Trichinella britovi TaxID=45882 RepID=A0A0V1CBE4_TRIBR|nr:hypothetical protein T03_9136 [Trichinella britovi]KRY46565.1 hypothetical protein T03_1352 [Trichinella britovi]
MAPKQKFNFCQCVHKHYGDSTLIGLSIHAIRWRNNAKAKVIQLCSEQLNFTNGSLALSQAYER